MPALLQRCHDARIGVQVERTRKRARLRGQHAAPIDGHDDRQAIPSPRFKVLRAVARGCVHRARPLRERHVLGQHQRHAPREERMATNDSLELAAAEGPSHAARIHPQLRGHRLVALGSHQQLPPLRIHQAVGGIRVERDGRIARQCPRGSGPNHHAAAGRQPPGTILHIEGHPDGRGMAMPVLDFRLGQCRLAFGAPVDAFEVPVDVAAAGHFAKGFNLPGFVLGIEGCVGILPIAQDPQALKLGCHYGHVVEGELTAALPQLHR